MRARLDKLRQRMRSVLGVGTVAGLSLAAVVLIVLAVLSLMSFVNHDSGLGLLLGAGFVAGVPLTGAAVIRAGQPWWQLNHEAALLRQREAELHEHWDRAVVGGVAAHRAPETRPPDISDDDSQRVWYAASTTSTASTASSTASSPSSADSTHTGPTHAGPDSSYGLPGQSWNAGPDPLSSYSTPVATTGDSSDNSDSEALHLAEYSALSPSSHVLARALRETLGTRSTDTSPADTATSDPADRRQNRGVLEISSPRQSKTRRAGTSTDPSWWSPTGLHPSATRQVEHADPGSRSLGSWGVLLAVGAVMTLFAIGIIAGILTSA